MKLNWVSALLFVFLLGSPLAVAFDQADSESDEAFWEGAAETQQKALVKTRAPLNGFPTSFAGLTLVPSKCSVVSAPRNTYLFVVRSALSEAAIIAILEKDPRVVFAQRVFPYKANVE